MNIATIQGHPDGRGGRFCHALVAALVGIKPVRASLIGLVEQGPHKRERWLQRMKRLGEHAR